MAAGKIYLRPWVRYGEVVLQHSCVHDTISVVSAHQSYTDECTSYFLYHFISSYPHNDQWLPYTTSWPDNWHTENFHCCALRWFITIYCKLTSTSFLWQLIFVIFRCPLTCNALSLLLDNFFFFSSSFVIKHYWGVFPEEILSSF